MMNENHTLAAVVTILGQPRFQLLHPRALFGVHRQQLLILLLLAGHQGFQFGDSSLLCHASMLDPQRKSASYHRGRAGENVVRLERLSSLCR